MKASNNSDNLDDFLKRKLENLEQEPSKKSWNTIREQLNATNRAPWTSYAEGFVLICLLSAGMFWLYKQSLPPPAPVEVQRVVNNETAKHAVNNSEPATDNESNAGIASQSPASKNIQDKASGSTPANAKNGAAEASATNRERSEPNASLPVNEHHANHTANGIPIKSAVPSAKHSPGIQSPPSESKNNASEQIAAVNSNEESTIEKHQDVNHQLTFPPDLISFVDVPRSTIDEEVRKPVNMGDQTQPFENPVPAKELFRQKSSGNSEFHFGLSYSFNNVWILNQNTYGDFYGSKLNYKVNFGSAYGFLAGYDYRQKFGVQVECNLRSLQGQKYDDVLQKKHIYRDVELQYTTFPVLFKYKKILSEKENCRIAFNYLAGLEYEHLNSAKIIVNDISSDATNRFRKGDVAGILGLETNVYFLSNFYFTFGGRTSFSTDINSPAYPVSHPKPGLLHNYTKSNNMLLGLNASLNYYFGK